MIWPVLFVLLYRDDFLFIHSPFPGLSSALCLFFAIPSVSFRHLYLAGNSHFGILSAFSFSYLPIQFYWNLCFPKFTMLSRFYSNSSYLGTASLPMCYVCCTLALFRFHWRVLFAYLASLFLFFFFSLHFIVLSNSRQRLSQTLLLNLRTRIHSAGCCVYNECE